MDLSHSSKKKMVVEDAMLDLYINLRKSKDNSIPHVQQQLDAERSFDDHVLAFKKTKPVKASESSSSYNSNYLYINSSINNADSRSFDSSNLSFEEIKSDKKSKRGASGRSYEVN